MKESSALRRTAQTLRLRGWCQGRFVSEDGGCCVVGALRVVFGYPPDTLCPGDEFYHRARYALIEAVVDDQVNCLGDWNDNPSRTVDDVLAALESTATRLEGEGR